MFLVFIILPLAFSEKKKKRIRICMRVQSRKEKIPMEITINMLVYTSSGFAHLYVYTYADIYTHIIYFNKNGIMLFCSFFLLSICLEYLSMLTCVNFWVILLLSCINI